MDASTYLRRKKESMEKYIATPKCMDAGLRTSMLSKTGAHYVSPNTKVAPINPCSTSTVGFTGSATAKPVFVQPGCCITSDTRPIVLPCCDMIYEQDKYVSACKVQPYYGTPAQQSEAAAVKCCNDEEVS